MLPDLRHKFGGFIRDSSGNCKWFSEKFSHSDFQDLKIDLVSDLQKSIACMETLAQLGILHVAARHFHATRMPIQLSSWSDNTGAEASTNKVFCTSKPLCYFVEKLCIFSALSGIEMDGHHVPGHDNDDLSRLDVETKCPTGFHLQDRVRLPLSTLWSDRPSPTLVLPDTKIPWKLPNT